MKLFGAGTDSGTFDYFTEQINGEEGASRSDYSPSEDDNVTVQGVSGGKGNLGYFGLSYALENEDKVKTVQVDGGDGCVEPTNDDGPGRQLQAALAAAVHLPVRRRRSRTGGRREFVKFYVDNYDTIAEQAQFVPMTDGAGSSRPRTKADAAGRDVVGKQRHRAEVPGAGALEARRLTASRRRYGEAVDQGAAVRCARCVSVADDGRDRGRAGRARRSTSSSEVGDRRVLHRHELGAAVQPVELRRPAARRRHAQRPRSGPAWSRCRSASARRSTCPSTRSDRAAPLAEAGARGAGRHPDRRLRLLRAHVRHAAAAGHRASTSRSSTPSSAGLVMGIMILPTVASLSDDAMTAVPMALREGAYGLGASQAAGLDPRGRAGGAVGHRRLVRARHLARGRRDDDRR